MINTQNNHPVTENDNEGGFFTKSFIEGRNRKFEQWSQLKKSCKAALSSWLHVPEKVDGISFWKINRKLNRLAVRGIPKEALNNRKIIIPLPNKPLLEWVSPLQKRLIEITINELEGFENLRLSQFYSYRPLYIEKKTYHKIIRWIEIEITQL